MEKQMCTNLLPNFHTCPKPSEDGRGCPGEGELDEGRTEFVCPQCSTRRWWHTRAAARVHSCCAQCNAQVRESEAKEAGAGGREGRWDDVWGRAKGPQRQWDTHGKRVGMRG